jgi:ionotropic glutamate receptor NMDA 2B
VILDYRSGQDDGCKLRVVGSWYAMTSYGIAVPKGSKYKEMFNRKILEYSYFGELERTRSFWFTGTCSQAMHDSGSNRGTEFGLLQSSSVFFMLAAGIMLGIFIHVARFLVNRYLGESIMKKMWLYENMIYNGDKKSSGEYTNQKLKHVVS